MKANLAAKLLLAFACWCLIFGGRVVGTEEVGVVSTDFHHIAAPDSRLLAHTGTTARDGRGEKTGATGMETVNVRLLDLELVDQDGGKVKFKSDVIGDKVAVIIPFYTTCTTSYPILIFMFTRLQEALGDRLGKDVVLISVSVDPRTDIPVRLKAYARRQKAKQGWVFLSGDRDNLGQVLLGVGAILSPNLEDHNHIPITVFGSAHSEWRQFHGFPSPEQILGEINRALPGEQGSGGSVLP
jgi:protein SCO1/2